MYSSRRSHSPIHKEGMGVSSIEKEFLNRNCYYNKIFITQWKLKNQKINW
jgi:hypothetical protein